MLSDQRWERRMSAYRRRRALREQAVAYLGGRCAICGYEGTAAAYDFHHRDPYEKDFSISEKLTSWVKIQPELDKCALLCARCHREVHDGLHAGFLTDHDALRGQIEPEDEIESITE